MIRRFADTPLRDPGGGGGDGKSSGNATCHTPTSVNKFFHTDRLGLLDLTKRQNKGKQKVNGKGKGSKKAK